MSFLHEIRRSDSLVEYETGGRTIAQKRFRNSFTHSAGHWFADVARQEQFNRRVRDTSIAGHHYSNERGDTLELR
jgi:hypothetical protein